MNTKFTPLVSIVIPTYNQANYLDRALQSVLGQTYKNWEAIIIDNHSIDSTSEVILNYNDPRFKYIKIQNHGIIAKSRNTGVLLAKGEWIAFLDSDDWWESNKLTDCLDCVSEDVSLIYHDLEIVNNKKQYLRRKKIVKTRKLKKPILIDLLVRGNAISNSSTIVRKRILEKIGLIDEHKDLIAAEDFNTWLKIASFTDQFLYLPKKLGYYFVHDQSVSRKNMSLPVRHATSKFSSSLNNKQKIKLESNIRYLSGRYNYLNSNYRIAKKDLLFTLRHGLYYLKLRAFFMLFMMIFK